MTASAWRATAPIRNAMSIDVEEYFHAAALSSAAPRARWDAMESRVAGSTARALELFAAADARATFFILGCVAERHPALIRRIAEAGHEIASHGQAHHRIREQTPAQFREDVSRAKAALEDASGQAVIGYRAANFSMEPATWWAYDVLAETGHRYSSSVNPVRHDHYGAPEAPRTPFAPGPAGIVELPMTTLVAAGRRWHASGGGYFRMLPYPIFRAALRRLHRREALPAVFYLHPWELDPDQPRLQVPAMSRFRHYVNVSKMAGKLSRLLADFPWDRLDRVFAREIAGGADAVWRPAAAMAAGEGRDGR